MMQRFWSVLMPVFCALSICMLAGCETAPSPAKPVATPGAETISFSASPGPEKEAAIAALLKDSQLSEKDDARVVRRYRAASGKVCTLIVFNGDAQNWIACSDRGHWQASPAMLQPDAAFGIVK